MSNGRIPDPTLMARLQLSVKGVDWAASLVRPFQFEPHGESGWTAHRHVWHLIDTERGHLQPRIRAMLERDAPDLSLIDEKRTNYAPEGDIVELAEAFMAERERTVDILKALEEEHWFRTGTWREGMVVDVAWVAERCLWHALDHFAALLRIHSDFEQQQAPRWRTQS